MIDYIYNSLAQGGDMMIPIILVNLWGLYLGFDLWLVQRKRSIHSRKLIRQIQYPTTLIAWLKNLKNSEKETLAGMALGRVLLHQNGTKEEMQNVMDEEFKRVIPEIEEGLGTIGILAASAPLLGLLGTVSGMVHTFHTIGLFGAGNPAFMSKGIAEALIATQNGIIAAVPLMLFHLFLTNRRNDIEAQASRAAQRLINYLAGKNPHYDSEHPQSAE
jgi:biopolymer transport protein ExbB